MKRQTLAIVVATALFPATALAQTPADASADAPSASPTAIAAGTSEDQSTSALSIVSEDAPQSGDVHTVVKGDTLWDLSERYLGSPWYWPKVWSYNPQIDNPHMIYPGNTIRFNPATATPKGANDEMPAQLTVAQPEAQEGSLLDEDFRDFYPDDELVSVSEGKTIGLQQSATRDSFQQNTFLASEDFKAAGTIDSAFSEKHMLSIYDKVYLTFESPDQVHLGDRYTIFKSSEAIVHPVTEESVGYQIDTVGTVRIVSVTSDRFTGIIESATDEIQRGYKIVDLSEFDKKDVENPQDSESTEDIRGIILASQNPYMPMLGEHHLVFIDKGADHGVKLGNVFQVIRVGDPTEGIENDEGDRETSNEDIPDKSASQEPADSSQQDENRSAAYPEETVGLISVIDVNKTTSVGMIIRSLYEINVGETVVIRSKRAQR